MLNLKEGDLSPFYAHTCGAGTMQDCASHLQRTRDWRTLQNAINANFGELSF